MSIAQTSQQDVTTGVPAAQLSSAGVALVALADPNGGSPIVPGATSSVYAYTNGLVTTLTETNTASGKVRTTTYTYTNGLVTGTTVGTWA